jgi:hypothetical protein
LNLKSRQRSTSFKVEEDWLDFCQNLDREFLVKFRKEREDRQMERALEVRRVEKALEEKLELRQPISQ